MKVLIAIHSCERDCFNGFNQAVRDTWFQIKPAFVPKNGNGGFIDYRFFVGRGIQYLKADEIRIDAPDDYMSLPYKTKATLQWAYHYGYDFIYKCDTDTYVYADRLVATDFENYDLVGAFNGPVGVSGAVEGKYAWVSGGAGYWLSRRAMEAIIAQEPTSWAEDLWISQVIQGTPGMRVANDDRYGRNPGCLNSESVSVHFCSEGKKRKFDVKWLHDIHEGKEAWG